MLEIKLTIDASDRLEALLRSLLLPGTLTTPASAVPTPETGIVGGIERVPTPPAVICDYSIPAVAAQESAEPKPAPAVTEDFRVEVRKTLARLNKKTGTNTASALIRSLGVNRLTDVPLEKLPALMEQAKEALDNAG